MKKTTYPKAVLEILEQHKKMLSEIFIDTKEIDAHIFDIISYHKNESDCANNQDKTCNVSHFCFYRDENNKIKTKSKECPKQLVYSLVNNSLIYSDYNKTKDFQTVIYSDTFSIKSTEKRKLIKNYITKIKKKQDEGCYIFGNAYSGKTFISFFILKSLLEFKKDKKFAYINLNNFCETTTNITFNKSEYETNNNIQNYLEMLHNVDYLFIDEVGDEKQNSVSFDKFYRLVKERINCNKITIFVANYPIGELKTYYKSNKNLNIKQIEKLINYIKIAVNENYFEIDK